MNQIVFRDGKTFTSVEYPIETEPCIFSKKILEDGINRDFLRITVLASYADVNQYFVDNTEYSIRQFDLDSEGKELETYTDYNWSEYSVAGDIVDHRDGKVTVYMSKPVVYETAVDNLITDTVIKEALN